MTIRHPLAALLLSLVVTAPSVGGAPLAPPSLVDVRAELQAIERLALEVHDPVLRRDLYTRARSASDALDGAERALRRGWDAPPRGLTYDDAVSIVQRESFDSGKVEAIRRLAATGRFTTEEARGIAGQCDFESSRIDALVALYPAVRDPQRYELALDVLQWPSSRAAVAARLGW